MKTSILIQARMGSSRLPGKVLMDLAGKPIIWHVIERAKAVKNASHVAVVTTTESKDDKLADYLKSIHVDFFRGSENDVLDRYYQAAHHFSSEKIVRITADCPLLDPEVTGKVIEALSPQVEFATNVIRRTFPRGLDSEAFRMSTLEILWKECKAAREREHVTPLFYAHPNRFKVAGVENSQDLSHYRWTVDEINDYRFVEKVYNMLYKDGDIFGMDRIVELLEREPSLSLINSEIKQKVI